MNTSVYYDIFISVPNEDETRALLASILSDLGTEGLLEEEQGVHCYMTSEKWNGETRIILQQQLQEFHLHHCTIIQETEIENRNWNEEWENTIQPIQITDNIIITPSWHPLHNSSKIIITIDPKMTFGTGYHETTRLMLRAMEKTVQKGMYVLDVGTGTGILAIAAIKLGAQRAVGIDTDELCRDNGNENILRNKVEGKISIYIGTLETLKENNFDLIAANIIRNTILELLPKMLSKLKVNGIIILSGLLQTDREDIEYALLHNHCSVQEVLQENEWIAMICKKM